MVAASGLNGELSELAQDRLLLREKPMIRRPLLLAAFPLLLLVLLAAERIATVLLGQFPANAAVWRIWIWLHSSFGEWWYLTGAATRHSFGLQLAVVAGSACCLLWASRVRKWMPIGFLANHSALIVASIPLLTANRSAISSLTFDGVPTVQWILLVSPDPLSLHFIIFVVGLVSCAFCHWALLSEGRSRHASIALRIRQLQQNL